MRYLYVFLFLSNTALTTAQSHKGFTWIGEDHASFLLDTRTGALTKETLKNEEIEVGQFKNWDSLKRDLPGDFDITIFRLKDKTLVTVPGTGHLYELDILEPSLNRLDQTFFRGYNFNANQFLRNDTIFSIGGEGFWQKHSIITFFNFKTLEWYIYDSKNQNVFPTNNKFGGYSKKEDAFFSAYLETKPAIRDEKIYVSTFSFKDKRWEKKGELTHELINFAKEEFRSVWTGDYLIVFKDYGIGNILIIDPFKNILYQYNTPDDHFFLANCSLYFKNGYLYSRSMISPGNAEKLLLDSIPIQKIIANSKKIGRVHNNNNLYSNIVLGATILMLLVLAGMIAYRKRIKHQKRINFSGLELLVTKEMLNHPTEKKFTTSEINKLLKIEDKSYDNQRQIRNRVFSNVNSNLYSFFNNKDFITRMANLDDKRMMDYYINPEIKENEIKQFLKILK